MFYCDALSSQQKGSDERNHVELRRALPKRKSDFDKLTERDVALVGPYVNSYSRPQLSYLAPLDLAIPVLEPLIDGFGYERIPPSDVNLTQMLATHAIIPGKEPGRKIGPEQVA